MLKKIVAAIAILGTIGLGVASPADAKPHNDWCHGCGGGHGGGGHGGWGGGGWGGGRWIPNIDACVGAQGPYGYVAGYICI